MEPATKKVKVTGEEQATLRPEQVKATSNIFGDLASDESSASEEDVALDEEEEEEIEEQEEEEDAAEDEDGEDETDAEDDATSAKKRKKNDPEAFATAMQKILGAGLTVSNRKNPILARSVESKKLDEAAAEERLELKARKQIAHERKAALDKNHKEAPNAAETEAEAARVIEKERQLRKVAQRGVVRLFNAIRVAQNAGATDLAAIGVVARKQQEQQQQLSKQSFLSLIKGSNKTSAAP
jgi:hypothetical protein